MSQNQWFSWIVNALLLAFFSFNAHAADPVEMPPPEPYCQWENKQMSIAQPICDKSGNAERGEAISIDSSQGNCVACHRLPVEGIEAFGNLGPPLTGVGARYSEGFIRLRVVDAKQINPMTIMPGYYRDPALIHRPAKKYVGRTFLTAQQVEDVVAYLVSLK